MADQCLISHAKRVREQADRFGILHDIDLGSDTDQLIDQINKVTVELATITGSAPGSGDFIGLVEHFNAGRFRYFR